jgi:hypothetical protein
MKAKDLRPWVVNDPTWTPGYVAPSGESIANDVPPGGFEQLLDSAAAAGDSAFIGVCFDIGAKRGA